MLGKEMFLLATGEKDETGVLEIRAPGGFPYLTGVDYFADYAGTKFPIDRITTAAVEVLTGEFPFYLHQEKPINYSYTLEAVENCVITTRNTSYDRYWYVNPENPKKRSIVKFTYGDGFIIE